MNLSNLPKGFQENVKQMEYALFGDFFSESGKLFADAIRYQRLKNQIKIYNKSIAYSEKFGIDPNKINLKLIAPLLENMSLESNDTVQDRWARIISNIRYSNTDQSFDLRCIEMMKSISDKELLLIDIIYEQYVESEARHKHFQKYPLESAGKASSDKLVESDIPFTKELFGFTLHPMPYKLNTTHEMVELYMERLLSYHIFRPSLPTLANKDEDTYNDLRRSDGFEFTSFGLYFVELCKIPKAST
ncbi:Abi-alpha family protein [Mucilaginibacter polytrichastri]|uniref:DUF4393 domain-containing protein n=1 Tax=Mucilaginibacter polytrichastri TaxID=1302689 RepID=A0A1Q5ZW48_9SPHI|nr:hypothetical protein [Mucilaginibacter polytrichastri]OKS85992.1 hypothetical protein RG47T_1439 [Mucilaginibacter polytrichastri]SFS59905.1 hypothetical protein SAMN04487890_102145 [Mucilaginibacter polytrichastri]